MPRSDSRRQGRQARARALRATAMVLAAMLGVAAVWLVVTANSAKDTRIGALLGFWALLLAAYPLLGSRHPEPAQPGTELDLRAPGVLERTEDAAARTEYERRLQLMIRAEIEDALGSELASLRSEFTALRSEILEKVGGQIRLERIETTRMIGSDLEALHHEVRQLKVASQPVLRAARLPHAQWNDAADDLAELTAPADGAQLMDESSSVRVETVRAEHVDVAARSPAMANDIPGPPSAPRLPEPTSYPSTVPAQSSYPQGSYPQGSYPQGSYPQTSNPQTSNPQTSNPQTSYPQAPPAPSEHVDTSYDPPPQGVAPQEPVYEQPHYDPRYPAPRPRPRPMPTTPPAWALEPVEPHIVPGFDRDEPQDRPAAAIPQRGAAADGHPGDDPFAAMPRIPPFTDFDLDAPTEASLPDDSYAGRRRRGVEAPFTPGGRHAGSEADWASARPTGGRRRRDTDDDDDVLARILERESTSG